MKRKPRDITEAQFRAACKRHGFKSMGFMGYFELGLGGAMASAWNAGPRRRDQLAYLIKQRDAIARRRD